MPDRSPEVWRTACQDMALRAKGGTFLYPVAVALLGVGSDRQEGHAPAFLGLVALVTALAFIRFHLILRFDELYDRAPQRWAAAFFGSSLATCGAFSAELYLQIDASGLTTYTLFAVVAAMGIAAMAIVLYAPALSVTWAYILLLGVPLVAALMQAGEPSHRWIAWCIAMAVVYLLGVAWQQHHERWAGLAVRHQLAVRAAELERAQVELQRGRDELERLVEERTRELERTSEDYRQIFENAHDAIIIFRPEDEQVLNVNRRACEIYGFTREEFLRISLSSISENVARGQEQIRETLEVGTYYNFESTQFRKDGSRMFLEINASKILYEGEQAIISINRDVTERRRAESLRLAKEAAERTARAKAQFLANMSHEVRTPMAGVVGLADLLLTTGLDEQQSRYARLIQSSTVSLLRVIDDILDFSKIEAGKLTFETVPFDLRATLSDVTELLRLAALARGTGLHLQVDDGVPTWVLGDPGRLRQVLMNLVGNAVKFTEGGEVSVQAGTTRDGKVHIRVRDTGIGIPAEAQGGLFELFSQADGSTSRRFGGTGLGLAISKRIVETLGGEIGFESAPGRGSLFWFTVALAPTLPLAGPESAPGRPVRPRRILAAEDNPINQLVITEHLKSLGYEVTSVANGLEALAELQARSYDLVLMDCQMPELDGYETTQRIRQLPGVLGRIPIIALTAHAIREDLDKCIAVGMNDTITKPFRGETLLGKLEHWLGREPGRQSSPCPPAPAADETLDEKQVEFLNGLREESDPEILEKLIGQFRRQPYVQELRSALERGDRIAVQGAAHRLKGTSSLLGSTRLPRLCAQLEMASQKGLKEECLRQLSLIEAEHGRVLHALSAVFMQDPS